MPDVKKLDGENRDKTHYIVERRKNRVISRLPEVDDYINESKDEQNKELRYGYIAHLIQDNIWFKDFTPKFGEEIGINSDNKELYVYLKEEKKYIRTEDEFLEKVYGDYTIWNYKLKEQFGLLNFDEIQQIMIEKAKIGEKAKERISQYLQNDNKQGDLFFINEGLMDQYFKKSIDEVSKKIDKMMKI